MNEKGEELRRQVIERFKKMSRELRQMIVDKESWNDNRLDAMPFDLGWDRIMLRLVERQIEARESNDTELASQLDAEILSHLKTAED